MDSNYRNTMFDPNTIKGLVELGNIDLYNGKQAQTKDGRFTGMGRFEDSNGNVVVVPTINNADGTVNSDETLKQYMDSGKHYGKFDNYGNAYRYMNNLRSTENKMFSDDYNGRILNAKRMWEEAFANGDEDAMSFAHSAAEKARQEARDAGMYDSIMSYLQNGDAADYNTAASQYGEHIGNTDLYQQIEQKERPVYEPPVQENYQYQYAMEAPSADYGNYSEPSADYSAPSESSEEPQEKSWLNTPISELVSEAVSSTPSYEDSSSVWEKIDDEAINKLPKLGDFLSSLESWFKKPIFG